MSWWEKGFYLHLTWTGPIHKLNKTAGERSFVIFRPVQMCRNKHDHEWPASWCNSLQAWPTANPLDAAESHPPGWQEERVEDVDEEETAGKTGCLSETQGKPEGEGAQALFYSCNCGESDHQYFMSEFIFNHFQKNSLFFPRQKPKTKNPAAIQKMRVEKEKYVQFCIVSTRGK